MSRTRPMYEEFACTTMAVGLVAANNLLSKRPLFARIYAYPILAAVGFGVGRVVSIINEKRIADRELAIWDYVNRHPEDFPETSPKKFKEVLETWHPIR